MEKFSLKTDDAFKELFAHEKVRKRFLSDVLEIPLAEIKSVRLATPFLRRKFRRQKQGILDVVLELNDSTKIDIEMQVRAQKHWTKRNLYYLGRMYTDDLVIGENYNKLYRCISISLLDFELLPDKSEYHSIYRLRDGAGRELTDLWEIHIIELGKTLTGSAVDDWIRLLNAKSQEEVDMIGIRNEGMRETVEVVRELGLFRTLRWIYNDYWKAKRDRWAEDEYVRDEGKAEARREDILQLLENVNAKETLPQELVQRIQRERDVDVLKRWHLTASKAGSVEQFMEQENLVFEEVVEKSQ